MNLIFRQVAAFRPRVECGTQLGFHRAGVEIAAYAKNDVIGMNIVLVPIDQILPSDGGDGGILGLAGVGIVIAICEFGRFACGNCSYLVVTTRNGVLDFFLRNVELVSAKFWILKHVGEDFENIVKVAFKA